MQEDLSCFYDTIDFSLLVPVLSRMGMPFPMLGLLTNFYAEQFRLLTFRGRCSSCWVRASSGLVQGCPCSPILAAALMHAWQMTSVCPGVSTLACQDDRTLILKPSSGPVDTQPLLERDRPPRGSSGEWRLGPMAATWQTCLKQLGFESVCFFKKEHKTP